jgi:hypothetical protein
MRRRRGTRSRRTRSPRRRPLALGHGLSPQAVGSAPNGDRSNGCQPVEDQIGAR